LKGKRFKGKVERAVSAGGVVYRQNDGSIEVALCGRRDPPRWSLPKGTPDDGETIVQTAVREAQEETGLQVEVEEPIGSIRYWFVGSPDQTRFNKTVHFYLMSYRGGRTQDHDPEFDDVEWFPAEEAQRRLTYPNEAKILDKALALIQKKEGKN